MTIDLNTDIPYPVTETDMAIRQVTLEEIGDESNSQIRSPTDSNSLHPPNLIDITGKRFGKWTVINYVGDRYWECICDCGQKGEVLGCMLRSGKSKQCKSCGNTKHGHIGKRIYRIWSHIKDRCNNPRDRAYKNYGGRGIEICGAWNNDFMSFYKWAMANGYTDNLEIDRINNDGSYTPENCRWTTRQVNSNNTRWNVLVEIDGETYTIAQLSRRENIEYATLWRRYSLGWRGDKLIQPVRKQSKYSRIKRTLKEEFDG